jgi:hypothetical protein
MQWLLRNALHLLYSNNTTVGNNVATHDGMLSARLFYWILNSPDLLDVNSPTNRGLTIVELGAGRGLCSFLAGSISIVRQRILTVELVEYNGFSVLTSRDSDFCDSWHITLLFRCKVF